MSKLVPKSALEGAKRWDPTSIGSETLSYHEGPGAMGKSYPTLRDIETIKKELHEQSYQKGFGEGYNDGLRIANEELAISVKAAANILANLKNPTKEIDHRVKKSLANLAIIIARQIIRREVNYTPEQIIPIVDEAVGILPIGAREIHIYLNPKDAVVLKRKLGELDETSSHASHWYINESEDIEQGGCRIHTENSSIDCTLENRIAQIVERFLLAFDNVG